jgi:tetratricopeptide (TPR) repeat protein
VCAPDEAQLWQLLLTARSLTESGDPGNGIACADEVIRLIGANVSSDGLKSLLACAHYSRGFALSSQRDFTNAARALELAIQLNPANASYYNEMGFTSNHLGHYDRALEMYRTARTLDDTEEKREAAVALRGMSFALIEKGNLSEAEQVLRESLEIEPGNEVAVKEIAHIYNLLDENEVRGGAGSAQAPPVVDCVACGGQFQAPGSLVYFLKRATAGGEAQRIDLPSEVFGLPLTIECPLCRHSIRLFRYDVDASGTASILTYAADQPGTMGSDKHQPYIARPSLKADAAAQNNAEKSSLEISGPEQRSMMHSELRVALDKSRPLSQGEREFFPQAMLEPVHTVRDGLTLKPLEPLVGEDDESSKTPPAPFHEHLAELKRLLIIVPLWWLAASIGVAHIVEGGLLERIMAASIYGLVFAYPLLCIQASRFAWPALRHGERLVTVVGMMFVPLLVWAMAWFVSPIDSFWTLLAGGHMHGAFYFPIAKVLVVVTAIVIGRAGVFAQQKVTYFPFSANRSLLVIGLLCLLTPGFISAGILSLLQVFFAVLSLTGLFRSRKRSGISQETMSH